MNNMSTTQTTFPTLFDLFQQWCNGGYPDYVTGIWSNDGSSYNLTVGVVEGAAGEAGKQEILDLIEDDASVTLVPQTYTHNYLMQIQEELLPYFEQDLGLVSFGLYDKENYAAFTDEIGLNTPPAQSAAGKDFFSPLLMAGMILIPLLVFGIYFTLKKRFVPVLQRNNGGTVAQTDGLSVKEVEELVKESSLTVSREVDEKVMEGIGKTGK